MKLWKIVTYINQVDLLLEKIGLIEKQDDGDV